MRMFQMNNEYFTEKEIIEHMIETGDITEIDQSGDRAIVELNGKRIKMDVVASYMDDDIRENLHSALAPCQAQEFVDAYVMNHKEIFNEDFEIN